MVPPPASVLGWSGSGGYLLARCIRCKISVLVVIVTHKKIALIGIQVWRKESIAKLTLSSEVARIFVPTQRRFRERFSINSDIAHGRTIRSTRIWSQLGLYILRRGVDDFLVAKVEQ